MTKKQGKKNNKKVAHTTKDKRYLRANKIKMMTCPKCSSQTLKEVKQNNYVWAKCTSCGCNNDGDERVMDTHLTEHYDVYSTIVDA